MESKLNRHIKILKQTIKNICQLIVSRSLCGYKRPVKDKNERTNERMKVRRTMSM